jgi:hypothetical protein
MTPRALGIAVLACGLGAGRVAAAETAATAMPPAATAAMAAEVVPAVWVEGSAPGDLRVGGYAAASAVSVQASRISRTGMDQPVWSGRMAGPTLPLPREPFGQAGFYRLRLRSAAGEQSLTVSVVAAPAARRSAAPLFGVNTHFAQREIPDAAYRLLRLANVDVIRDQWVWSAVETTADRYQMPSAPNGGPAHQRRELEDTGLRLLHDCAYTNPLYDGNRFPTSAEAIAQFAGYCAFIARQFGPALYGSEIWNESNRIDAATVYAPLAQASAAALRAAVPSSAILVGAGAGAGGGADPLYEETVLKTIGAACCTGFSIHPYMTNPDVGYFAAGSRLSDPVTRQSIVNMDFVTFWADYLSHLVGLERGSNVTEIGWSSAASADGVSIEKQAAYVSRTLIDAATPSACTLADAEIAPALADVCRPAPTASAPDLKALFIYDFQDDGPDPANREHRFGMVHQDLTPKAAYSAFAQAASVLRGSSFHERFRFAAGSLAHAVLFETDPRTGWLVLWTQEFKPAGIAKSAGDDRYPADAQTQTRVTVEGLATAGAAAAPLCREWDGHPCRLDGTSLEIANLPVYLEVHGDLDAVRVVE